MTIGVLREPAFENRVSLLAENLSPLLKSGIAVIVETGAGLHACCSDQDYEREGATILSREEVLNRSDVLLSIHDELIGTSLQHKILIGIYQPLYRYEVMEKWAGQGIISFSLDMLPRTTRAQTMDVLSSQANIAGYKAVLIASTLFPRYLPMFMTAAGTIAPARVMILGAGVAGLQAVATARRLGAVVEVFDTRTAVKEEVLSLGGRFIEVPGAADASAAGGYAVEQSADFQERQRAKIAETVAKSDIIITTAQIPGKPAPILISAAMIETMKKGSVIIDLAAATGGNTELTKNGETIVHQGVTISGSSSLASTMPYDASKLYGRNVVNFIKLITGTGGALHMNYEDDLVRGCCITRDGQVVHERVKSLLGN